MRYAIFVAGDSVPATRERLVKLVVGSSSAVAALPEIDVAEGLSKHLCDWVVDWLSQQGIEHRVEGIEHRVEGIEHRVEFVR